MGVGLGQSDSSEELDSTPDGDTNTLYKRVLQLMQSEFEGRIWKAFIEMTLQKCLASDVASELGMTVGTVRQAKYKVLRRLREQFSELLD